MITNVPLTQSNLRLIMEALYVTAHATDTDETTEMLCAVMAMQIMEYLKPALTEAELNRDIEESSRCGSAAVQRHESRPAGMVH